MNPMNQTTASVLETGARPIYLSCSAEDLILVIMRAWEHGFNQADVDSHADLTDIAAIEHMAEQICDHCLEIYIPLDLERFRKVFTSAWCAGYRTGVSRKEGPRTREGTHP